MTTSNSPPQRKAIRIIWWCFDFLLLAFLAYFLADRFNLDLLLQPTIMTGGDSASWYQIALYLKQELLPSFRLMGWNQDNFLGYPEFQYYFIPPFLLAVLLSYVMPLAIALKIVSVIGLLAFPFVVYWALHHIQYRRPVPMIGAWLSLIFIFHERFNMFGANVLSTLAGEFSYSLAFLLQVIFMATMIRGLRSNKTLVVNALLLALIGLSHAFVFLTAIFIPLFLWWKNEDCIASSRYLIKLYVLAFLLMAFWTIPMLAQIEYTTPVRMIWAFSSLDNFLSMLNYEVMLAAGVALLIAVVLRQKHSHWSFYIYMILVSAMLYLIASLLKIPDIRFFPPLLFFSLMLIVDSCNSLLKILGNRPVPGAAILLLAVLAGGSWLYQTSNEAPEWWLWNFSGYDAKPAFRDGSMGQLADILKSDALAPRVAWEKADYNTSFGSDRVFESLPLFTGRKTLEGIHYSSALLSNSLSWLLGEYSLTAASPEALVYAHYNIDILPARFQMFNIAEIIVRSDEMKSLLTDSPEFEKLGDAGELSVFKYKTTTGDYVSTPAFQPQVAHQDSNDWKASYYAWFQRAENLQHPVVDNRFVTAESRSLFPTLVASIGARGQMSYIDSIPVSAATIAMQKLDNFEISFRTDAPGKPHIIKVAYSPNWKSRTGEIVFPISPGLMLIYPKQNTVTLYYQRSTAEYVGLLLFLLGLLLIAMAIFRHLRGLPPWQPSLLHGIAGYLCQYRRLLLVAVLITLVITAVYSYQIKQSVVSDYQKGVQLNNAGDIAAAEQVLLRAASDLQIRNHPQNPDVPHAITALAWLYAAQGQLDEAMVQYRRLLHLYPNWQFIHQIHDGVAQLHERQGHLIKAAIAYERCAKIDQFSAVGIRCKKKYIQLNASNARKLTP